MTSSDWLRSIRKRKIIGLARKNIRHYYPTMFVCAFRLLKRNGLKYQLCASPNGHCVKQNARWMCVTTQAETLQCISRKHTGSMNNFRHIPPPNRHQYRMKNKYGNISIKIFNNKKLGTNETSPYIKIKYTHIIFDL